MERSDQASFVHFRPEVNYLDVNSAILWKSENFVSIGKFPDFWPISYCLPGPANWPTFANRKFSFQSEIFISIGNFLSHRQLFGI